MRHLEYIKPIAKLNKFQNTMLKSTLCDYSDAYILAKGTITIAGREDDAAARQVDKRYKVLIYKNCSPFTYCVCKINITQADYARDADVGLPMYNLLEYSDNYSKTLESLWQCFINGQI